MADTHSAGPLDGNIAGFRESEKASILRVPGYRKTAARKGNLRAGATAFSGRVRGNWFAAGDSWGDRGSGAKYLGVNALGRDTPRLQINGKVGKKSRRPAKIEIRVLRQPALLQGCEVEMPGEVVIPAQSIAIFRPAVRDQGMTLRKAAEKASRLGRKWMFPAVSSAVAPPDLPHRVGRVARERVKHRENRSRSDTGAQQHNRFGARSERETASGRAHLKHVAGSNGVMEVTASWTVCTLHADAILSPIRRA